MQSITGQKMRFKGKMMATERNREILTAKENMTINTGFGIAEYVGYERRSGKRAM